MKPVTGFKYRHTNGGEYTVLMLINENSGNAKYPPSVVYKTIANGNLWGRPISDWGRSFTQVTQCKCGELATSKCADTPAGGWGTMKCGEPLCDKCKCGCKDVEIF